MAYIMPLLAPTIQSAILKAGVLTDEAVRNGSLKRSGERRGDDGESSKEGNVMGDNKRAGTGKVFATITNPVRNEYAGLAPKCTKCNFHHNPETSGRVYTNCNCLGHISKDCKAWPMMVNPLNAKNPTAARGACYECGGNDHYKSACPRLNRAPGQGGNHPNQDMAIEGGQGHGNNVNPARGRAFVMGAEEARQDPNIVMGTFSLNNHFAMMLFDSGADYSFVSTTFVPLLDIEPSSLGFSYDIEIASGQLVEINKVIHDCKLEIEGHTFDIDLIPFRHGSFDVIIAMDWLSRHRAEIVYHERVVQIPLPHDPNKIEAKHKKYVWGDEQDVAFQTLKDKLCNAPVLALPDGPRDFLDEEHYIYRPQESPTYLQSERLNMSQRRWIELFNDYDCEIRYHPGKANVVADVLSKKERIKPRRVQDINMTIQLSIKGMILAAQNEASEVVNAPAEMLRGLDKQLLLLILLLCHTYDDLRKSDGALYYMDQIWIPLTSGVRTLIMDEAHKSRIKKDIALYISKHLTCSKVKAEHHRPSGLLHKPEIPEWK
ncbi:putative reverse transcriptase domain-containing protein [Tanacetum coccineum]